MKYNAFISYSHAADGKMAPALQSALERFAKPWYKIRNLNIFRDESSLSVTPHLWPNIQSALDKSEYLIYLASPKSAESPWVKKEIEYWLENKSLDTLLIGLTSGEISIQNDSRQNSSLPQELSQALKDEPFYIDLRIAGSKQDLTLNNSIFKKEVLKLAAQLHGKAPKDMASTEVLEHRKMVWLRNSAIVVLIALLGFSIFQTVEAKKQTKLAIENEIKAKENETEAKEQEQIAIQERDKARKAKDETVPWVILSTWTSANEYNPPTGYVTGIRGLIKHAKSLISLEKIRYLSPVKIFTKGPHDDEYDWKSQEFGHYNPKFLEWASKYLIPGANDEKFRQRTQKVYDKHLKILAESYCRSYENLHLDKAFIETQKQAYLDYIAAGNTKNFFNQGVFSDYFSEMDIHQPGVFPYYAHVAAGFWIRREIDGTSEHFIKAIRKLIKAYDPELYKACSNIKHPFITAIAEFIPGIWRIYNDNQNNAFARFETNGGLWIQVGDQSYQHSWESIGKNHFKIDGKDVKENFKQMLIGLPELGEQASITKLYAYRPKAWDDYAGVEIDEVNTTYIRTQLGEFNYSGYGYWHGPNASNEIVEYTELGRNDFGIYLYREESHTYIKIYLYRNQVFLTAPNQPARQWTLIEEKGIEEIYEGPD